VAGIDLLPSIIIAGVAVLGSGGAAFAGVKVSLNGMREQQKTMAGEVGEIREDVADLRVSVGVLRERTRDRYPE